MPHESQIESIRDGLRERYHQKIIDRAFSDDINRVAFVLIDMMLELMTDMLKEYDRNVRKGI